MKAKQYFCKKNNKSLTNQVPDNLIFSEASTAKGRIPP